jgi:hypothetical protein
VKHPEPSPVDGAQRGNQGIVKRKRGHQVRGLGAAPDSELQELEIYRNVGPHGPDISFAYPDDSTAAYGNPQAAKPITKSEIIELLKNYVSSARIVALARERGIAFVPSDMDDQDLQKAGADAELLKELHALSQRATATNSPAPAASDQARMTLWDSIKTSDGGTGTISTTDTRSPYSNLLSNAKVQLEAGQYKDALAKADEAAALDEHRWEAYVLEAKIYAVQSMYDDAVGMLQMALPRAPLDQKPLIRSTLTAVRAQLSQSASGGQPQQSATVTPGNPTQGETTLWKAIENSQKRQDFEAYLEAYPNGAFVPLAKRRITELSTAKKTDLEGTSWDWRFDWIEGAYEVAAPATSTDKHHQFATGRISFSEDHTCAVSGGTQQPCHWTKLGEIVTITQDETEWWCMSVWTLTTDPGTMSGTRDFSGQLTKYAKNHCPGSESVRLTLRQ